MYLELQIGNRNVTALLDSGSAINILSKSFYDSIPQSCILEYQECADSLILANNTTVTVYGTAVVKVSQVNSKSSSVTVYILKDASHPIILGTEYLKTNNIVLDFNKSTCFSQVKHSTKIRSSNTYTVLPNSECVVNGSLSKNLLIGMQGVAVGHAELSNKGLIVAKSVVTCNSDYCVPVKILNPGNETVYIHKGTILATFQLCDNSVDLIPLSCSHVTKQIDVSDNGGNSTEFQSNFDINPDLPAEHKTKLYQCLYEHRDLFITKNNPDLGHTKVVKHEIHLKPDAKSKHQRPYRLPPDKKQVLRHQLDELLTQGIIAPVSEMEDVPITSPIVLVAKRNKPKIDPTNITKEQSLSSYRFCCDFRYLNSQTQDFRYTIPDLQDLTESFAAKTPNFITSLDLTSGFFQMEISSQCQKYTAFNTCYGTFKFLRLPQGLRTAPNSFQLLMDKILHGLTFNSVLCYLDDICIFSETFEQHISDLHEVLSRLQSAGLKLKPKPKCKFGYSDCIFLGHSISKNGISPPSDRVELLKDYPVPQTRKELQRALGMFNWFRKYIPNYSAVSGPLHKLLKKKAHFIWSAECEQSFQTLKDSLLGSTALAFPRFDLEFRLAVDTSSKGIGYMLYQIHEDENPRVVRFGSKGLSKWQHSYGPTKLELLGVVTSILDCASYLRGHHFTVECDHQALKPLFQKQLKGAIYDRWLSILQQFDFDILYKPASQMTVPDSLSRYPHFEDILLSSPEEADPYFPYNAEKPTQIKLVSAERQVLHTLPQVNHMVTLSHIQDNEVYDADTEDNSIITRKTHKCHRHRKPYAHAKMTKSHFLPDQESHLFSSLDSQADRQPIDLQADRQPIDLQADRQPIDSQADRQPIDLQADRQPIDSQADRQPIDSQADRQPIDLQADRQPIDLQADRQPIDSQADRQPIDLQADRQPIDSQADRQPIDSQADRQPIDSQADRQPIDSQADRQPIDLQADRQPIDLQADRQPIDSQADRQPIDLQADRQPIDSPADRQPIDLQADRQPIDSQADRQPIDSPADRQPIDLQADRQPIDSQADRQPIDLQADLQSHIERTDSDSEIFVLNRPDVKKRTYTNGSQSDSEEVNCVTQQHSDPYGHSLSDSEQPADSQLSFDDIQISNSLKSDLTQGSNTEGNQTSSEIDGLPALTLLDLTPDSIRQHQAQDSNLRPVIHFLSTGVLPRSQKLARSVLLQQSEFVFVDGILFHSRIAKAKRTKSMTQYQLVLPETCVQAVLHLFHDSTLAAHGGIQDTIDRIKEHFYFPRLTTVVSEYVLSCHACQARKITKSHAQNEIVAYPTPSAPFSVWQIDLYGPLPCTSQANTYIFTAVCMFSKFLYAVPIRNKDAVTVSEALFQLFTTYGCCDCLLSDRGTEFTARVTSELCKLLLITQQFSPSFVHHCLGAVERSHATLAARLTPYMNANCNNWDVYVHSVVFAMNNSVNAGLGYSPFEVIFAQRPRFPLAVPTRQTFQSLPVDIVQYLEAKQKLLTSIRDDIQSHLEKYRENMTSRTNADRKILKLSPGDYVYLTNESGGSARKLRNPFNGPLIVESVLSPHMVQLRDPVTDKVLPQPVHLDRVKLAYVRHPSPTNYHKVLTKVPDKTFSTQSTQTELPNTVQMDENDVRRTDAPDSALTWTDRRQSSHSHSHSSSSDSAQVSSDDEKPTPVRRQSKRTVVRPLRFRDSDHVDPFTINANEIDQTEIKIKRILAQRHSIDGLQYLVQVVGGPAQNATWILASSLDKKAKTKVTKRPPPFV